LTGAKINDIISPRYIGTISCLQVMQLRRVEALGAKMTGLDYAVLGLLADGEKTGYDILKILNASPSLHWKATAGSVYPTLDRLERQGLVVGETVPQERRPNRKIFRLSGRGREAFLQWLANRTVSTDPKHAHHVLLKLVFAHHISPEETIALIEAYRERIGEELGRVENIIAQCQESIPVNQYLALTNGAESLRAQLLWTQTAMAKLEEQAGKYPDGAAAIRSPGNCRDY